MNYSIKTLIIASALTLGASSVSAQAQHVNEQPQEVETLTKGDNDTYIINTTNIGAGVRGYRGPVPLLITIQKDKVQSIETLPNRETRKYMRFVSPILEKWNGLTVKKALKAEVDGVTGATFTSNAIKENVKLGLEYYKKNK